MEANITRKPNTRVGVTALALAAALLLLGGGIFYALSHSRAAIQITVTTAEPARVYHPNGHKLLLVELAFTNRDIVAVAIGTNAEMQARIGQEWIGVTQAVHMPGLAPGRGWSDLYLMPPGSRCRVRLQYEKETWKSRLAVRIGDRGRRAVTKIPWLASRILPARRTFESPPEWQTAVVDVEVPGGVLLSP